MEMPKVLFVCIHNSARSQMAEAFLNNFAGQRFKAQSAGLKPGKLNPLAVKVMFESGIDISNNRTKTVQEYLDNGSRFDYVITVCDETSGERCPYFPGDAIRLHWTFEDPSELKGTDEEKLKEIRIIRDKIKGKILQFVGEKNYEIKE